MVLRELLGPTDLLGAQTFYIHKTTDVVVVCENKNLILAAFQVIAPWLKGFKDN